VYVLAGLLVACASVTIESLALTRWLLRLALCAAVAEVATLLVQRASAAVSLSQRTVGLLTIAVLVCTITPGAVGWVMRRQRAGLRFAVVLVIGLLTFFVCLICDLVFCFAGRCSI